MKKALALSALLLVGVGGLATGCGSKPPPAADAPASSSAASDSAAPAGSAAPASSGGSAAADGSGDGAGPASVDSQREPFMQGCMKKMSAPDYCQCGFEQFRALFKDSDISKVTPDDPRFAQLQQSTQTACASKLPEDTVKATFLSQCAGPEPKAAPFCQCEWTSFRKTLAVADFLGAFQGPRFDDARKAMVKACKGKFPADVAKTDFITSCTKDGSATASRCACVWKKIRAKYSAEEYAAGLADPQATPGLDACK